MARPDRSQRFSCGAALVALLVPLIASACSGSATTAPRAQRDEPLSHAGRWITDASGDVVMFHGANMVAKRAPYSPAALGFDDDDAAFLAANGLSVVRLGIIFKGIEPTRGVYDDQYVRDIAATVDVLGRHGIMSLLDFHDDAYNEAFGGEGFPDWAVPPHDREPFSSTHDRDAALADANDRFWSGAPGPGGVPIEQAFVNAAAHVASFFTGNRHVLGYDIFNEPFTGARWPECTHDPPDCSGFDHDVGAFEQRVMDAIRRVDNSHLLWYEPNPLFNWGLPTRLPAFRGNELGMSFHDYCAPGARCRLDTPLRNAEDRSRATGDAIMLTEFGAEKNDELRAGTEAADASLMSWTVWAYCGCHDPTGSMPPEAEGFVRDPSLPLTGSNVDDTKRQLLARPYPHVIAGTPEHIAFDAETRMFSFDYSTARADGSGRFGKGACTSVLIPPVQYAAGYSVAVNGARVASAPGAGTLVLRASGHASRITVVVTPNANGPPTQPVSLASVC